MQKPMKIMLLSMAVLFGGIFLYKLILSTLISRVMRSQSQAITVSVMTASYSDWQKKLAATGSLRAIRGVNVTTQLAGMVEKIFFKPGSYVKENDILVQLIVTDDIALLHAQQANEDLAKLTYARDKKQLAINAISQQILDNDIAKLKNIQAQVAQQQAIVDKKTIRAPFSGYLGINYVNPGQYVNPGDKVTTLQQLDPIYLDFFMPQQNLAELQLGQILELRVDVFPNRVFKGSITTIEPAVDINTRNVAVEASFDNKNNLLKPGMFANAEVIIGKPQPFITVPQTAITFNSYGDVIYIVKKDQKDNKPRLTVQQRFVKTGDTRGEQIQVLKGLTAGEQYVTSGQLKLHNGSEIIINNSIAPPNNPNPVLPNNH